jgi:type VII secretion protein EccE
VKPAVLFDEIAARKKTVYRRNTVGWLAAWRRWRRQRRRPPRAAAAIDVPHGNIVCGVRADEREAITMVRVTGQAYAPTLLRGSTVSLTTNAVPLELLVGMLDQPGALNLAGIDVVNSGHRVRRGSGYPPLYSTLLADRPAAGRRETHLIVRLDITNSVPGLRYRHSIGAAAAAATERIINALVQEGIRASALSAEELDTALDALGARLAVAPTPPEPQREPDDIEGGAPVVSARASAGATRTLAKPAVEAGWRTIKAHPGFLTSYYFSPEDITSAALHQMWALRSDGIVQTTSLWKNRFTEADGGGPVMVSALVRTDDPQRPPQPPTLYLNPLPGGQYAATLRSAPTARPRLNIPARRLGNPADLQIPIGSTGVLVGAALRDDRAVDPRVHRDDLVMWALTDPHRATRIVMNTGEYFVRQLLIRAAAVGELIAIYSNTPDRWIGLSQPNIAVVERRHGPEFVPSIIVNDRPTTPPSAGLSSTVITLGRGDDAGGPYPDIRFVQTSRESVRITTATRSMDVAIVAFRQEQAWMGL